MRRNLAILSLLAVISAGNAEILVYKAPLTVTRTGSGIMRTEKWGGWTMLDTDTGEVAEVTSKTIGTSKRFSVYHPLGYAIDQVFGPGKSYTVYTLVVDTPTASALDFVKGQNVPVTINGKIFLAPKLLKVKSNGIFHGEDAETFEGAGNSTLDLKRTSQFDGASMSMDGIIEVLRAELLSQGFMEE
jgi:hypothetical protein